MDFYKMFLGVKNGLLPNVFRSQKWTFNICLFHQLNQSCRNIRQSKLSSFGSRPSTKRGGGGGDYSLLKYFSFLNSQPTTTMNSQQQPIFCNVLEPTGDIDVDYIRIQGKLDILFEINKDSFNLGASFYKGEKLLSIASTPGYVLVDKKFKSGMMDLLENHFKVSIEPSGNQYGLFKVIKRRISTIDLIDMLSSLECDTIVYVNYAMKSSLKAYKWIDDLKVKYPDTLIYIDLGRFYEHPEDKDSIMSIYDTSDWNPIYNHEPYSLFHGLHDEDTCLFGSHSFVLRASNILPLKKGLFYSQMVHVFKSQVLCRFNEIPKKGYSLNRMEEYFSRVIQAYEQQPSKCHALRVELRVSCDSIDHGVILYNQYALECMGKMKLKLDKFSAFINNCKSQLEIQRSRGLFSQSQQDPVSKQMEMGYSYLATNLGIAFPKINRLSKLYSSLETSKDSSYSMIETVPVEVEEVCSLEEDIGLPFHLEECEVGIFNDIKEHVIYQEIRKSLVFRKLTGHIYKRFEDLNMACYDIMKQFGDTWRGSIRGRNPKEYIPDEGEEQKEETKKDEEQKTSSTSDSVEEPVQLSPWTGRYRNKRFKFDGNEAPTFNYFD